MNAMKMVMVTGAALALATACNPAAPSGSGTDAGSDTADSDTGGGAPTTGATTGAGTEGDGTTGPTSGQGVSDSEATTAGEATSDTAAATTVDATSTGPGATTEAASTSGDTTGGVVEGSTGDASTSAGDTTGGSTGDTTGGVVDDTGDASTSTSTTGAEPCGNKLQATVRDFSIAHPDFEKYGGNVAYKGIVEVDLGADQKPVYAHPGPTPQTSGPDAFKQWYNDTAGVNQAFPIALELTEIQPGIYQYNNSDFFPIDGLGFGNEGFNHNFAFTTEIHTEFIYNGGEVFTFTGDDDLWMFINGKLAIDLGGLHPPDTQTVDLDASAAALGISPGNVYSMDIFHAERHSTGSNFRIDTTIGCFVPQ